MNTSVIFHFQETYLSVLNVNNPLLTQALDLDAYRAREARRESHKLNMRRHYSILPESAVNPD